MIPRGPLALLVTLTFIGGFYSTSPTNIEKEVQRAVGSVSGPSVTENYFSEPVAKNSSALREQICSRIENYAVANTLSDSEFHYLPDICTPVWRTVSPKTAPTWTGLFGKRSKAKAGAVEFYESNKVAIIKAGSFKNFLRKNDLIEMGVAEKNRITATVRDAVRRMGPACCGGDTVCLRTFNATTSSFCAPVLSGPNWTDCIAPAASTVTDYAGMIGLILNYTPRSERFESELLRLTGSDRSGWSIFNVARANVAQPIPSSIQITPFRSSKSLFSDDAGIAHELGHVCTAARLQASLFHGGNLPRSDVAIAALHFAYYGAECKIGREDEQFYQKNLGVRNGQKLMGCLKTFAMGSTQPSSQANIHGKACPMAQLEEATAIAFSIRNGDRDPNATLQTSCLMGESSYFHPKASLVLNCLLAHDSQFRTQFQTRLRCRSDRIPVRKATPPSKPRAGAN